MVRKVLVLFMIGLITVLVGCDYYYCIYRSRGKVVIKVELIYYDNPEARENPSVPYRINWDKLEVLSTLDESQIVDFITELEDIAGNSGRPRTGELFSHDGKGLRITYEDNYYDIITMTTVTNINREKFFYSYFDNNDNLISSEDNDTITSYVETYNLLLKKYFPGH